MQKNFTPYSNELLPKGFKYPELYLNLSENLSLSCTLVWWFEDSQTDGGRLAWKLRSSFSEWGYLGSKNLIPFAQFNDDAAFFDGGDFSGDPKVIVIDLGNKRRAYEVDSFEEWLKQALEDSQPKSLYR